MSNSINGYELSRSWFDWCFENPELINPNHTAIYFFAIEHCNRLGWKSKFGFPSQMTMDALGIKKNQTYTKYFNDIVKWGGFTLIQKSTNQYSANIISINAMPKNGKALDKALIRHGVKQTETTGQSNSTVYKQETINKEQETNKVYNQYPSKCPTKKSSTGKSLKNKDKIKLLLDSYSSDELINIIDRYVKECLSNNTYMKNFSTFLNNLPDYTNEHAPKCYNEMKRKVHYKMRGVYCTHHEKAYLENLKIEGAENIEFLNYVD